MPFSIVQQTITPGLVVALLFVLVLGCGDDDARLQAEAQIQSAERKIEQVNARFEMYIAGQHWDSLSAIYTEDAIVMPQGAPEEQGPDAIRQGFMQMGEMGVTALELESQAIDVDDETAYEVGHYTLRGGGQRSIEVDRGKYLAVWKRVDGDWKIHRDMFNSNSHTPEPADPPGTTRPTPGEIEAMPDDATRAGGDMAPEHASDLGADADGAQGGGADADADGAQGEGADAESDGAQGGGVDTEPDGAQGGGVDTEPDGASDAGSDFNSDEASDEDGT